MQSRQISAYADLTHGSSRMILDRLYAPAGDELIYHYCTPEAFIHILSSRTVWLSAYYTLNDFREREWGYTIFQRVLQQLRAEVGDTFANVITQMIHTAYEHSIVMISSYSIDPDV